tara:strand:+ start:43 stop:459 length:417 start_codon:yes stop_codon:yes gene_type:complete
MGINSQGVAYNFGQLGSGHLKALATDLVPPHGKVIVAITMLEEVSFDQLVGATDGSSSLVDQTDPDTRGDGVAFFGTQTQTRANGLDQSDSSVESVSVATTVLFPAGLTIYGRWSRVSLADADGSADFASGIIVYYGY